LKYQTQAFATFSFALPSFNKEITNAKNRAPPKKLASAKNFNGNIDTEPKRILFLCHF